jgi:hypothetical protein
VKPESEIRDEQTTLKLILPLSIPRVDNGIVTSMPSSKKVTGAWPIITAPDGVSATLPLPSPHGVVSTIATRGYGQCTWYVANQRLAQTLPIPIPAYQTTAAIDASYIPQQWDVLDFANKHSAIIISPITTTQVHNLDGSTVITYDFTIGEMNVKPAWQEQSSTVASTFVVNVSPKSRKKLTQGILSDYSTTKTATAYFR